MTQNSSSISILSWALNEEENIESFLLRAKALMDSLGRDYEHILIDDGSTDQTLCLAEKMKAQYPQLKIIKNEKNLGSGWCTRIAVNASTKDLLFWQTVDWSYDISKIPEYLNFLDRYDVVQGVRVSEDYLKRGNTFKKRSLLSVRHLLARSDSFSKAIISVTNYLLVRILFGVPAMDFQNVTIYPRKLAQSLDLVSTSSFINPEMLIKSYWRGIRIKQVPIPFIKRTAGEAKGTRLKFIWAAVTQILYYWFHWIVLNQYPNRAKGVIDQPDFELRSLEITSSTK